MAAVQAFLRKIGKKGGRARAKSVSATERRAASSRGGRSRWSGLDADQRRRIMARVRAKRKKSR